ncbi:hypothetical protein GeomeDRAFT_3317 [Geobacter metallireducens RCH3]|nr:MULTISPECIES: EpsG family protein [Geobacter]EHP83988.1 hypothetical protein GeomeDRAFT_3317 [Geobacter metallireducens RCH3]MBT1075488.1 EpsG family protein [Geobacter grbiciae]
MHDIVYILLFVFVAVSAFVSSLCQDKALKFILFSASTFFMSAIIAFRWEIGTDWNSYYEYFVGIKNGSGSSYDNHFDIGFYLLNFVIANINGNYTIFLIVTTVLSTVLVNYIIYKKSNNPHLGQLIFLGNYLPIHFMGSIRRSIAITFVFLFLIYSIQYKNKIKSYIIMMFAFAQHKTSIIGITKLIVPKKRFSVKVIIALIGAAYFINYIGLIDLILEKLLMITVGGPDIGLVKTIANYSGENYKLYSPENVNPQMQSLLSMIKKIIYLFFFTRGLARNSNSLDDISLNIYVIGIMIYTLFIGAMVIQVLSVYFLFMEVLLASRVYSKLRLYEKRVFLIYILVISYASYDSNLSVFPELFSPYRSVLF